MLQDALRTSRDILNLLADILNKASEIFRWAVDAIIFWGTEQHKSIFVPSVAADIKKVMQEVQKDGNIILFIDEIHTIVGAGV